MPVPRGTGIFLSVMRRLAALLLLACPPGAPMTAVAQNGTVRFLEERIARDPEDILALNRLAGEYLQAYRRTGDPAFIPRAARTVEKSLQVLGEPGNPGAFSARAAVNLARHRFAEALTDAETYRRLKPEAQGGRELRFDALVELGRLDDAAAEGAQLKELFGESLGWHARQARLARLRGDRAAEQRHRTGAVAFTRSQGDMLAPHWRAWALLQRGATALTRGDFAAAEADYTEAAKLDDSWLVQERLGELRGAQSRWDECLALLRSAAAASKSPATFHALGDALLAAGKKDEAKPWLERAEAAYRATVEEGEMYFAHNLVALWSDSLPRPAEALALARRDLALRRTPDTLDALAWAHYQAGEFETAWKLAQEALAWPGAREGLPHLLQHAGYIAIRAGQLEEGRALLKRAVELNPAVAAFHLHR